MKLFEALGLDIRIFTAQFVNFAVLFFVLYKFGYQPIFDFLNARRNTIEKGIQNAKDADLRLISMQEKEKDVLLHAKKESQKIIMAAEQLAQKNKEEVIHIAKQEAESIMISTRKKMQEERDQVFKEVKMEISALVISATEKVLSEKIDMQKDAVLINKAVEEVF